MRIFAVLLALLVTPAHAQMFGASATVTPALALPVASPAAVYSVVKLSGWAGNCAQVQRASDGTTLDIGWTAGNLCNKAAADTFGAGSALTISKWYDQSGSGNDLVQATAANQPIFSNLTEFLGIRPISLDATTGQTAKFMTAPIAQNRNAVTVYQVVAPKTAMHANAYFSLTDAGFTSNYVDFYTDSGGVRTSGGVAGNYARSNWGVISWSSGAAQTFRVNGKESTAAAFGSQAVALFNLGRVTAGTGYNGMHDFGAVVVYGAAHTSAQMQQVEAALAASFPLQTAWSQRFVYGGSSLIVSYFSTLNQRAPLQGGFGLDPRFELYVAAIGGNSLVNEYAGRARYIGLYDATKSKNVVGIDAPSNDIAAATYADQPTAEAAADLLYTATTVPFVQALKAAGFSVWVPTTIARGALTTANFKEYARLRYNLDVVNGAVANGYAVSDRASDPKFSSPAATADTSCYAADATHLVNACYQILSRYDKAAALK